MSPSSFLTSGRPATEVRRDRRPAKAAAEQTTAQFTSDRIAEVPIVAIAVCATVFKARMPAALIHF